jgi:hypothetical protein
MKINYKKESKENLGLSNNGPNKFGCNLFISLYEKSVNSNSLYYFGNYANKSKSLQTTQLFYSVGSNNDTVYNGNNKFDVLNSKLNEKLTADKKNKLHSFFIESDERRIELFESNREDIVDKLKPQFGQLVGGPLISDSLYKAIVFALKYYKFQNEYDKMIQDAISELNTINNTKLSYTSINSVLVSLNKINKVILKNPTSGGFYLPPLMFQE